MRFPEHLMIKEGLGERLGVKADAREGLEVGAQGPIFEPGASWVEPESVIGRPRNGYEAEICYMTEGLP